jgi:hypothetical protein
MALYFQTKPKKKYKIKRYSKQKTKTNRKRAKTGLPPVKRFLYSHIARLITPSF